MFKNIFSPAFVIPAIAALFTNVAQAETSQIPQIEDTSDLSARFVPAPAPQNAALLYASDDVAIVDACPQLQNVSLQRQHSRVFEEASNRRIAINGEIPPISQFNFGWMTLAMAMDRMAAADESQEYLLTINSTGGNTNIGRNIIERIQASDAVVTTYGINNAGSMASLALFSGDTRMALNWTRIGVHEASAHLGETVGNGLWSDDDILTDEMSDSLVEFNGWFKEQYLEASSTGVTIECVEAVISKRDIMLSPQSALRLGWIDRVYINGFTWYERSGEIIEPSHKTIIADTAQTAPETISMAQQMTLQ